MKKDEKLSLKWRKNKANVLAMFQLYDILHKFIINKKPLKASADKGFGMLRG